MLLYYPETREVEMIDIKNRRSFLKRVRYDDIRLDQLFVGNTVTIFSRQLRILEFADDSTRSQLAPKQERRDH